MYEVRHLAGLAGYKANTDVSVEIEPAYRRLKFISWPKHIYINFEDITAFTFDEHYKRSAGKTAAGAIVGGVLTGGIGLLAGAALGARRSGDHTLILAYKLGQTEVQATFKGARVGDFYNSVIAALSVPEPEGWNRSTVTATKDQSLPNAGKGCLLSLSIILSISITMAVFGFYFLMYG